jgi:hypothetical protein
VISIHARIGAHCEASRSTKEATSSCVPAQNGGPQRVSYAIHGNGVPVLGRRGSRTCHMGDIAMKGLIYLGFRVCSCWYRRWYLDEPYNVPFTASDRLATTVSVVRLGFDFRSSDLTSSLVHVLSLSPTSRPPVRPRPVPLEHTPYLYLLSICCLNDSRSPYRRVPWSCPSRAYTIKNFEGTRINRPSAFHSFRLRFPPIQSQSTSR